MGNMQSTPLNLGTFIIPKFFSVAYSESLLMSKRCLLMTYIHVCYVSLFCRYESLVTIVTVISQYLIPMMLIAITYGQIVRKLWTRDVIGQPTMGQQQCLHKVT